MPYQKIYLAPEHKKQSRFLGVYWDTGLECWTAIIYKGRTRYDLGMFPPDQEEEAARIYDAMTRSEKFSGDQAFTNFGCLRVVGSE